MPKSKVIFKTEVNKIRAIKQGLSMHQKLSGTQVILSDKNRKTMLDVVDLLSTASNLLESIK